MRYKPEYFTLKELFPPEAMTLPEDHLWGLFDESLLVVLDRLRIAIGKPITINNWASGGQFKWRGYRTNSCKIGAKGSMHRYGKAVDLDVKGMTAQQVREWILKRQNEFPEITRMEDGVSWVHIDTKPRDGWKGIKLFKP